MGYERRRKDDWVGKMDGRVVDRDGHVGKIDGGVRR
jgi:hypothetical protein